MCLTYLYSLHSFFVRSCKFIEALLLIFIARLVKSFVDRVNPFLEIVLVLFDSAD